MDGIPVFDRLASRLSEGERQDLFDRLKKAVPHNAEPIAAPEKLEAAPIDRDAMFRKEGLLGRLFCIIMGFFLHQKPEEVYGDRLIRQLRSSLEIRFPTLANYRAGLLSDSFLEEIQRLKNAARFFYPAFELSFDKDKGGFISFLASLELAEAEERLKREADAGFLAEEDPTRDEQLLLKAALDNIEDALSTIPESSRRIIYARVRSLTCLRKLVSFPFDRFSALFTVRDQGKKGCPFSAAVPQLKDLASIFASLAEPLSMELLGALFTFPRQGRLEDNIELIQKDLSKAETALEEMRSFCSSVPLVELIRLMDSSLGYRPEPIAAGEDWMGTYRQWWKSWAEARFSVFVQDRSKSRVVNDIVEFLKGRGLMELENVSAEGRDGLMPLRHETLLRFALSVMEMPFIEEMNRPLKLILIEGQFYRQDNRLEYTDAYSRLIGLTDAMKGLSKRLGRDGELGKAWEEAKSDVAINPVLRQRKLLDLQQKAGTEAEAILGGLLHASETMMNLIGGIIGSQGGGRYDSLQNVSAIDGRRNAAFRESLSVIKDRFQKIITILRTLAEADSVKLPE